MSHTFQYKQSQNWKFNWKLGLNKQKNMFCLLSPASKNKILFTQLIEPFLHTSKWKGCVTIKNQSFCVNRFSKNGPYWAIFKNSRNSIRIGPITKIWQFWENGLPEWSNNIFARILFYLIRPRRSNKPPFTHAGTREICNSCWKLLLTIVCSI